jgi:hypothetical protein
MTAPAAVDLAAEIANAHSSATLASADRIAVSFSSGGLAFAAKRQPDALARVEAQQIILTGATPRPWTVDVANSDELRSRLAGVRSGSCRFRWQPEELGVFAAAAIWACLTLPLLVHRAEHVHRVPDAKGLRRLRITLPPAVAGHGRVHTLHVGSDSLIRQHGYTAPPLVRGLAWRRRSRRIGSLTAYRSAQSASSPRGLDCRCRSRSSCGFRFTRCASGNDAIRDGPRLARPTGVQIDGSGLTAAGLPHHNDAW